MRDFRAEAPLLVEAAAEQAERLLRRVDGLPDEEVGRVLGRFGFAYYPLAEGLSYRGWLAQLPAELRGQRPVRGPTSR